MSKIDSSVASDVKTFNSWEESLRPFWASMVRDQEAYEFYREKSSGIISTVTLNNPFMLVESLVARFNEINYVIDVQAKGNNGLTNFESYISNVLKDALEDRDVADFHDTFRVNKEKHIREMLIKGNAVSSINWCYVKHNGKVVADNPYIRHIPLFNVIFNPAKTLSTSNKYYIKSFVTYDELKAEEYNQRTKEGKYKNLKHLRELAEENRQDITEEDTRHIIGDRKTPRIVEKIKLLEVWEGDNYRIIANDTTEIYSAKDPYKMGTHNLVFSMLYVVGDRPYAYGEIDPIYKQVEAQDTVLNQSLDIVNRYLKPAVFVGDPNADLFQVSQILSSGGVMRGNPDNIRPLRQELPPAQAFTSLETLQFSIERAARFSPYASGIPSSQTDRTKGTKGGIIRLQEAAEPNFQLKVDIMRDSFFYPVIRKYMKLIAGNMSSSDIRYSTLQGKDKQFVKVTKNILNGKASLSELLQAGFISQELFTSLTMTIQEVVDPITMQVMQIPVEIPGADRARALDVDWIIKVTLDSQAASNKEKEIANKMSWIGINQQLGVPIDAKKVSIEIGRQMGIDEPERLLLSEEQVAEMKQAQMPQGQQMPQQPPMPEQPPVV